MKYRFIATGTLLFIFSFLFSHDVITLYFAGERKVTARNLL